MAAANMSNMDYLEQVLEEAKQDKEELKALHEENKRLIRAAKEAEARYEKLKPFEKIIEEAPQYVQIWIRDSWIIKALMAECVKLYGRRFNMDSNDPDTRKMARRQLEHVVIGCIKSVTHHPTHQRWAEVESKYLNWDE